MTENEIKRYYLERIAASKAAYEALEWVQETGGTIITDLKKTFDITFSLDTSKKRSCFKGECSRYGVELETIRGGYSVNGERIVYLYLIDKELAEVESHLNLIDPQERKEILLVTQNKDGAMQWIEHYHARSLNCTAGDSDQQSNEVICELPEDISEILASLAIMAAAYDSGMKWNEKEKLKADLMNNRKAWMDISIETVRRKCSELGMSLEDTNTIADLIEKIQAGKRLVPANSYTNFEFKH